MSTTGCVALLGDFSEERLPLSSIGREFSWSTSRVANLGELEALCRWTHVVAVLIHSRSMDMPWNLLLNLVRAMAPGAKVVMCYSAAESGLASMMTEAGAFHTLMLPLDPGEVKQSLGFVSASSRTAPGTLLARACIEAA